MKKVISIILGLLMLFGMSVMPVSASGTLDLEEYDTTKRLRLMDQPAGTWYKWYVDSFNANSFAQPSKREVHSGDFSLLIRNDAPANGSYLRIGQQLHNRSFSSTNYRLSFYAKGNMDMHSIRYGFTSGDPNTPPRLTEFTVTEAENGWKKYETTMAREGFLWMVLFPQSSGTYLYVDDFSAVGIEYGEEIFTGDYAFDFEDAYYTTPAGNFVCDNAMWLDEWSNTANAFVEPTDYTSYDGNKSLYVRWTSGVEGKRYKINKVIEPGTYDLSMKIKKLDSSRITFYTEGYQIGSFITSSFTSEPLGNRWEKITRRVTIDNRISYFFLILSNCEGMFIDDITFTDVNGQIAACVDFEDSYLKYGSEDYKKPTNWTMYYGGHPTYYDGRTNYVEVTDETAYDGKYAIKLAAPSCSSYQRVLTSFLSLPQGEYDISFYTKGKYTPQHIWFELGSSVNNLSSDLTGTSVGNGWYKHGKTLTVDSKGAQNLSITTINAVDMIYIDNITLTKKGETQNLIVNGSFEQNKLVNKTKISNLIAYPTASGTSGTVSWRNPETNVSGIKLYVNDEEKTDFTYDLSANAINSCLLSGLTEGNEYTVRLDMTTSNGTDSQSVILKPKSGRIKSLQSRDKCGAWEIIGSDYDGSYADTSVDLDKDTKYGGAASLRLNSNMNGVKPNVYVAVQQALVLNTNKDYKVSFKAKLDDGTIPYLLRLGNLENVSLEKNVTFVKEDEDRNGWVTLSAVVSDFDDELAEYPYEAADYNGAYALVFTNGAENIWIDDISAYVLDDNGDEIGENLISDGGFELTNNYQTEKTGFTNIVDGEVWELDSITSGVITASKKIECYDENMDCVYYVALYKGDVLVNVQSIKKTVVAGTGYEIFSLDVTVPENSGYKIKTFMWTDDMIPLSSSDSLS